MEPRKIINSISIWVWHDVEPRDVWSNNLNISYTLYIYIYVYINTDLSRLKGFLNICVVNVFFHIIKKLILN